jgi:CheY-like chemotaxis protein
MKKILVIEDDTIMRENMAEILELSGYEVEVAENGKQGVSKAKTMLPDLIVCDIKMPVLDGYGVLHILNKDPKLAGVPFIFVTAKTDRNDRRKGMEMGADDYITKPFEDTELLNAVEIRLKKSSPHSGVKPAIALNEEHVDDINGFYNLLKKSAENLKVESFKSRDIIFRADDYPHFLFYVEKGQVKMYRFNDDGKEFISQIYHEGEFFGYQPLIENRTYQQFAEAMEDCTIHKIPKEDFLEVIGNNKSASELIVELISKSLTQKEKELSRLAYDSVMKRLAISLIEISDQSGNNITVSRTDLAALVGTSPETLVRSLTELKEMNLIDTEGHKIKIVNRKELIKIKNRF